MGSRRLTEMDGLRRIVRILSRIYQGKSVSEECDWKTCPLGWDTTLGKWKNPTGEKKDSRELLLKKIDFLQRNIESDQIDIIVQRKLDLINEEKFTILSEFIKWEDNLDHIKQIAQDFIAGTSEPECIENLKTQIKEQMRQILEQLCGDCSSHTISTVAPAKKRKRGPSCNANTSRFHQQSGQKEILPKPPPTCQGTASDRPTYQPVIFVVDNRSEVSLQQPCRESKTSTFSFETKNSACTDGKTDNNSAENHFSSSPLKGSQTNISLEYLVSCIRDKGNERTNQGKVSMDSSLHVNSGTDATNTISHLAHQERITSCKGIPTSCLLSVMGNEKRQMQGLNNGDNTLSTLNIPVPVREAEVKGPLIISEQASEENGPPIQAKIPGVLKSSETVEYIETDTCSINKSTSLTELPCSHSGLGLVLQDYGKPSHFKPTDETEQVSCATIKDVFISSSNTHFNSSCVLKSATCNKRGDFIGLDSMDIVTSIAEKPGHLNGSFLVGSKSSCNKVGQSSGTCNVDSSLTQTRELDSYENVVISSDEIRQGSVPIVNEIIPLKVRPSLMSDNLIQDNENLLHSNKMEGYRFVESNPSTNLPFASPDSGYLSPTSSLGSAQASVGVLEPKTNHSISLLSPLSSRRFNMEVDPIVGDNSSYTNRSFINFASRGGSDTKVDPLSVSELLDTVSVEDFSFLDDYISGQSNLGGKDCISSEVEDFDLIESLIQ